MAYSQISYGSAGEDVKKLQSLLNAQGYDLAVDGIFGAKTQAAVKDYQSKNSLAVDGIAGINTWSSLTAKEETAAEPVVKVFEESDWLQQLSQQVQALRDNAPADYQFSRQEDYQAVIDEIINRQDFDYDINADALYHHYKDQYAAQGKLAMLDTMGQAAAKTGGYGNSYAQTAGQQAYQSYLQKVNEVIPQLYNLAYDRYDSQSQALFDRYNLLKSQNDSEYEKYRDALQDYYDEISRLESTVASQRQQEYQAFRDEIADSQYAEKLAQDQQQFQLEYALKQASANKSSGSSSKTGLTISEYNAISQQCQKYAQLGQDQLAAYLKGLVENGSLSADLAWEILQSFFPLYEEKKEIYDV